MSKVLQISDPHFGTEQPRVVEALARFARQQRPDLVVLSGDITQRALPTQFHAARAFVDSLRVPVLAIPGNHDIPLFDLWARVFRPYARHMAAFGSELEPLHIGADLMVVCINTTRNWRHTQGELSERQVERVARTFEEATSAHLRIAVVHQPVAVTRAEDQHNLLRGHAAALERWSAAGIDLVLGGHIHLPYVVPVQGLTRPVWAVQAGTSVSSRVRQAMPNSVNLLRWANDARPGFCRIEQWDYSALDQSFALAMATEVQPHRSGCVAR